MKGKLEMEDKNCMRLFMNLDSRNRRSTYITQDNVTYQIVSHTFWCGYDLREKPYEICIKDKKRNLILYSTLLYHFATKEEAREFCDEIMEQGRLEEIEENLLFHWRKLIPGLEEQFRKETRSFQKILNENGLTFQRLQEINEAYRCFPSYLKKFIKHKFE